MERQLTVRLPEGLAMQLEQAAVTLSRHRSEIVRMALERMFDEIAEATPAERPIDRVRDLIGAIDTGISDLGERHREHLLRKLTGAR